MIWKNLSVKQFRPWDFFAGSVSTTNLIPLVYIGLFRWSISSWMSLTRLCLSRNLYISLSCWIYGQQFTITLSYHFNVCSSHKKKSLLLSLIVVFCVFSLSHAYFNQSIKKFINFINPYKDSTCSFIDFSFFLSLLQFHWFLFVIIIFFSAYLEFNLLIFKFLCENLRHVFFKYKHLIQ